MANRRPALQFLAEDCVCTRGTPALAMAPVMIANAQMAETTISRHVLTLQGGQVPRLSMEFTPGNSRAIVFIFSQLQIYPIRIPACDR